MSESIATASQGEITFFAAELTKRQKLTRRLVRVGILLGGVAVVYAVVQLLAGVPVAGEGPGTVESTALPVTTMIAERVESYARERQYTGLLREVRRSQLSFQRGGELLALAVDEGDNVAEGQLLGRLDARHIRAQRAQIEAQVSEAKAVLDELVAGPRKETIAAKRAELRAAEAQSQVLAKQLTRRKQLLASASVSREEYETFLFDYQAAVARTDVVKRQLDEMLAGTCVEQIAAQRARLAQLDAQLTDLAHDLEDTRLVAPFAGRVAKRMVDEGAVIAAGSPVVEIIEDGPLEAWVGLPPSAAKTMQVGESIELEVDGEMLPATVQSLAPDVQQSTRTRNVILRLRSQPAAVFPGQVVRLSIAEQVSQPGYWVPTTALNRGTRGLWSVYVVEEQQGESTIARRDVELLDTVGSDSFVRGTLQPGEQIVASGAHRVVVGQRVTIESSEKLASREN